MDDATLTYLEVILLEIPTELHPQATQHWENLEAAFADWRQYNPG